MSTAEQRAEHALKTLLPAIAKNLKRTLPPSITVDDLMGAGALALAKLARDTGFDWNPAIVKFRIRGAMIDSIKGKAYREATHAPLTDVARSASPSPEEAAIRALDRIAARRVVARLPPDERIVLACVFEGMSLGNAAKKVGVSESTARRRRASGVLRIRAALRA